MRLFAYCIFDRASGVYDRPFFAQTDQVAVRSFCDICSDGDTQVGQHPDDYTLFRVGTFDNNKGLLQGEVPEKLINGLEATSQHKQNGLNNLKDWNDRLEEAEHIEGDTL